MKRTIQRAARAPRITGSARRAPHFLFVSGVVLTLASLACDEKKAAETKTPTAASTNPLGQKPPSGAASEAAIAPPPPPPKKARECPKPPAVDFEDKNLETEVRRKLEKPEGPITVADLGKVRTLNLSNGKTNELDVCVFPHMTALKEIFLGPGDLVDLSPLAGLKNVESLRASINHVTDLKPLQNLTKLDRLDLGRTSVKDLTPLGNLTNLTELQLDDTPVLDIGPLSACAKLERLSLKNTMIKDVSALKDMKKLKFLYITGSAVEETSALSPLIARGLKIVR
jgi:internalin A